MFTYYAAQETGPTLYTGVTSDLKKRVYEHKNKLAEGFTSEYGVDKLVWYEMHETSETAFLKEKQIKKWNRAWKKRLIQKNNPYWNDLYEQI